MPKCGELSALMLPAVSFVFVAAIAATSSGPVRADNACIEQPTQAAPEGTRWYVRYDRAKGRKCWFLGSAPTSATPPQTQPSPEPTLSSKLSSLFGNLKGASANAALPANTPQSDSASAPRKPQVNPANANKSGGRTEQRNAGETRTGKRTPAMSEPERNALFEQFLLWHEGQQSISTLDPATPSR